MSFIYGTAASITWGTGFNADLVSSTHAPVAYTLSENGDIFDTTRLSSVAHRTTGGLRNWNGSIRVYNAAPKIGCAGIVSLGTYDAFLNEWTMTINYDISPTTLFNGGTCAQWATFTSGGYSWNGTLAGFLDSATVTPLTLIDDTDPEEATAGVFSTSTGNSLSGNVFVTNQSINVDAKALCTYASSFVGDSTLTAAGTEIFTAGALTGQSAETLVLTSSSGKTYTGSALRSSITVRCKVDEIVETIINFQGTGTLTKA